MATSSIFANVKIADAKSAEKFVTALETSYAEAQSFRHPHATQFVSDAETIKKMFTNRKNK